MKGFVCSLLLLLISYLHPVYCKEKQDAYQYINTIRRQASLPPFDKVTALENASQSHADYLLQNHKISHFQVPGSINYSGHTPVERAVFYGYPSAWVMENVSSGHKSVRESIDQLMGAIYHRLVFLSFQKNEIGVGFSWGAGGNRYVYKMGLSPIHRCQKKDKQRCYQYSQSQALKKAPLIVVWPPNNGKEIPAAFYEEVPDPVPEFPLTGYPISIQFNPFYFKTVRLKSFKLTKRGETEAIRSKIVTKYTDVNRKIGDMQFVFFPLNRLEWGTTYEVNTVFNTDLGEKRIHTVFSTKVFDRPVKEVRLKHTKLALAKKEGQQVLYFPPEGAFWYIERLSWVVSKNLKVQLDWFDNNTLGMRVSGQCNDQIEMVLNQWRKHQVILTCDNAEQ